VWGIGPDQYREVDLLQKPLHNDLLAFAVERGVIGLLGLVAFAALALYRAARRWRDPARSPTERALDLVFLAAVVGFMVHAQFHQIFHHRAIWLVLALLEAG
jgi:O-antigen ligase